jgi:HK97 family phage major capsid protein
MIVRSSDLKSRVTRLLGEARAIEAAPAGDNGNLNPEQEKRAEEIMGEVAQLETRIARIAKIEEAERREIGTPITGANREWSSLVDRFELRQAVLNLDEGKPLSGATAEVVGEMRNRGSFRGVPVPLMALERRAGETVASGVPDPKTTRPIIDRLFPSSVAGRMGVRLEMIDFGLVEYPVVTSSVTASWAATETGNVASPQAFATTDKPMAPNYNLGVQMKITRRSLKQTGPALEDAVRRDMSGAIEAELDRAIFRGAGSGGEPAGILVGSYGITSTPINDQAEWSDFRAAVVRFMAANAAKSPSDVRLLIHPETYDLMDAILVEGTAVSEWDRLTKNIPLDQIAMSSNALADGSLALLTTTAGGIPPAFVGVWGGVDLIRDPYSDAASGGLRLTAIVTADVTVGRPAQLEILSSIVDS